MADRQRVMSTSARRWAAGVFVAGVLLVVFSYALRERSAWWSDLLLNGGATVLLFVPLLYVAERIERRTERRISEVETAVADRVETLVRSLREVDEQVQDRLDAQDAALIESFNALRSAPSQADVHAALTGARERHLISEFGVRFDVPTMDYYLRFLLQDDKVMLLLDTVSQPGRFVHAWTSEESFADALVTMASDVKKNGHWTGPQNWVSAAVLDELADMLSLLLALNNRGHISVHDAIQLVGSEWIICDWAIVSASEPWYTINLSRLREQDWFDHMSSKTWVHDQDDLRQALDMGALIWDQFGRAKYEDETL